MSIYVLCNSETILTELHAVLPEIIAMTFYRLSTKLRKSNVFSRVCLSVCLTKGSPHVTITHDTLDLTTQGPPHDIFKLVRLGHLTVQPLHSLPDMFKLLQLGLHCTWTLWPSSGPPCTTSPPPPSQYSCQVGGLQPTAMFSFVFFFTIFRLLTTVGLTQKPIMLQL